MILLMLSAVALILLAFSWYAMLAIGSIGLVLIAVAFALGVVSLILSIKTLRSDPNSSEARISRAIGVFVTVVAPVSLAIIIYAFYRAYGA